MSDKPAYTGFAPVYAWMYPELVSLAREKGYALAVHGSMNRDADLIAVPWTDDACPPEELIEAIRERVRGSIVPDGTPGGRWDPEKKSFVPAVVRTPSVKPHGRLAWNIHLGGVPALDISVMPRRT